MKCPNCKIEIPRSNEWFRNFDIDATVGQLAERKIISDLETIEVKADQLVGKTGNLFVEFQDHGKLSGINTTTAKNYCFVFDCDGYNAEVSILISTERLKKIIRLYNPKIVLGGDDKAVRGYLIKKSWLIEQIYG